MPGVKIIVSWDGGEEQFFAGLKPELSNCYADYIMTPEMEYTIQLAIGSGCGNRTHRSHLSNAKWRNLCGWNETHLSTTIKKSAAEILRLFSCLFSLKAANYYSPSRSPASLPHQPGKQDPD